MGIRYRRASIQERATCCLSQYPEQTSVRQSSAQGYMEVSIYIKVSMDILTLLPLPMHVVLLSEPVISATIDDMRQGLAARRCKLRQQ